MAAPASAAARRYARALFELAREQERIEAVQADLDRLVAAMQETPALHDVLVRPLYPAAERRAVLEQVGQRLSLSPLVSSFCSYLIDQRRTRELGPIRDEYVRLAEEAAGRVRAEVVSAAPLSEDHQERLRRALSRRTGRDVRLELRVEPELLAGVVARVGDLVFDGSLRTQLAQLRSSLTGES